MTEYRVFHRPPSGENRRTVLLGPSDVDTPEGFTLLGTANDTDDDGKVPYHYIRDLLYHEGVQNMQDLDILPEGTVYPTGLVVSTNTVSVEESDTFVLNAWVQPGSASNKAYAATSDDTDIATVAVNVGANTVTITGVAEGSCEIEIEDDETGDFIQVIAVTVTASD
jgi:uncharacterized protein YjdB